MPRTGRFEQRPVQAFTLVELLIVVAIIGLLIAILLPSLSHARTMTLRALCAGNLHQIDLAMNMYLDSHNETYPCASDPVSTDPFYWLWMGRGWRGLIMPQLNTVVNKTNPSVLYCPADPANPETYQATSYAYSMAFYHSPAQIDSATSTADTYSNPKPSIAQRTVDVASPRAKIVLGEWTSNHQPLATDKGWWCWNGARNFLLADGQIRFLETGKIQPARDNFPDANLTVGGIKGRDIDP